MHTFWKPSTQLQHSSLLKELVRAKDRERNNNKTTTWDLPSFLLHSAFLYVNTQWSVPPPRECQLDNGENTERFGKLVYLIILFLYRKPEFSAGTFNLKTKQKNPNKNKPMFWAKNSLKHFFLSFEAKPSLKESPKSSCQSYTNVNNLFQENEIYWGETGRC